MENRAHALAAGLFLLLMGLAVAAAVSWFQSDHTDRVIYTVVATKSVPGLNLKAPVKLRGVEVGKVESIGFDPADVNRILVTIGVDKAAPVTTATYAQLGLQGVTGLSYIDLENASDSAVRAAPGAQIALRPTLLDRLAATGPDLITGFAQVAQRLNALLNDGNRAQFAKALAQVGRAADEATRMMAALEPGARALPALLQQATTAVRHVDAVVGHADVAMGHADDALQAADRSLRQIDALVADGRTLAQELRTRAAVIDRLGPAAAQVQTTARNLDLALVGAIPPRTRPLVDDIAAASHAVERTAGDLGAEPQSLLFGRTPRPPGPGESGFDARLKAAR